jgi:hypothetical protein
MPDLVQPHGIETALPAKLVERPGSAWVQNVATRKWKHSEPTGEVGDVSVLAGSVVLPGAPVGLRIRLHGKRRVLVLAER